MGDIFILLFLIFDLFLISVNSQSMCPVANCNQTEAGINETCFKINSTPEGYDFILSKCQPSQYCPIYVYQGSFVLEFSYINNIDLNCTDLPVNYYSKLDVGQLVEWDFCDKNSDCASNNCTNGYCIGLKEGEQCTNTSQCNSSCFCDSLINQCVPRRKDGEECFEYDNCQRTSGCLLGLCVPLYSLPAGTPLNSSYQQDSMDFCESSIANLNGICEDLIPMGTPPYLCDPRYPCNYTLSISKQVISMDYCICDLNGGNAYCPQGTESINYKNYNKASLAVMNSTCHSMNKYNCANTNTTLLNDLNYVVAEFIGNNYLSSYKSLSCLNDFAYVKNNPNECRNPPCKKVSSSK